MLQRAGQDLWLAEGPVVRFLGVFPFSTRMAVVRLANGDLWVWSPVALSEALAEDLVALGSVRHLVSPNKLHHLALGEWVERFPNARLYASPGLRPKRRDLHFAGDLGGDPDPAWAGQIDQVVFRGSFVMEEVVFFHRASRTVLVADLIQRIEWGGGRGQVHGVRGLAMWLGGVVGPDGGTPRDYRATFWRRGQARAALHTALAWNPQRLVIAHGALPEDDGRAALARGLRWLG